MKTSLIRQRVADFLASHPPFQFFSETDRVALAASGRVQFYQTEEFVFQASQPRRPLAWVVQQGAVEIWEAHRGADPRAEQAGPSRQLRDLLGEGEVFGLERGEHYAYSARAVGDVLLYALDLERFRDLVSRYPAAEHYMSAAEAVLPAGAGARSIEWGARHRPWLARAALESGPRPLLSMPPTAPIRELARRMAEVRADVVAITDPQGQGLGVVTTAALRDKVATGEIAVDAPAMSLMTDGLPTLAAGFDLGTALLAMVRARSPYLGITGDGHGRLSGIITDRDLPLYRGINPVRLMMDIEDAREAADLARVRAGIARVLADGLTEAQAVPWYGECLGELNAALLARAIALSRPEDGPSLDALPLCWLVFGAAGRQEVLMPALPEIAVLYRDPPPDVAPAFQRAGALWAGRVLDLLGAAGFRHTSTPTFDLPLCLSLSAWQRFFDRLVGDPIGQGVYACRTLFDMRLLRGDPGLARELESQVDERLRASGVCIAVMANDTMVNLPPLTLFRALVVDSAGHSHAGLDLKHTVLEPLADVARVFALARDGLADPATRRRLERAARSVRSRQELFLAAADTFSIGQYYATRSAIRHGAEASLVELGDLRRYDHQVLKRCFRSVLDLLELTYAHFDSIRAL